MSLEVGKSYEVEIEKLIYGGHGLAHTEGHTLFVSGAAPGDRVLVRVLEIERKLAKAVAEEIVSPSPIRREPRCSHFGICGGCHLQHIEYSEQLKIKSGFIRESINRIGRIDWKTEIPVLSGDEFGYRTRAEIKLSRIYHRSGSQALDIGFFKTGSHEICSVSNCAVLDAAANEKLGELHQHSLPPEATRVYLTVGDDQVLVTPATGENAKEAEVDATGKVFQEIAGKKLGFGPRTFFQSNRRLTEVLVAEALRGVEGETAFDLYAGAGLFTLPLADRFKRVFSVEGSPISSEHAKDNAILNHAENIEFHTGSVEGWLKYQAPARPDLVLLDPPRVGAGPTVVERLLGLQPAKIVYVSCDPTTLARDLKQLVAGGYQLVEVTGVDMFPQTYHVETIAKLRPID